MTSADTEKKKSGVAWFGEIPQDWRCEHLKRFTKRIQAGMTPPTNTPEYYFDGTIPWFAPGSFNGDIDLRKPRKLINELARNDGELRIFPIDTVFLVGIGATIGKVGLVSAEASCNQQLIGIVCDHRMHSRFLAYQFKIYEDVIPSIATATTLPIFDQVKTGYLPVCLPSLAEQQRIAAYLDAGCAAIDAAVTAKRCQLETLDALRKTIIHKAVTFGLSNAVALKDSGVEWLGRIPIHWQVKRIKDIVDLKSGDAITSDSITPIGNYPVFGGNGLRGYTISYTHNGFYLLIGRQGALCGNINYAEGKFWASEHAVVAITLKKHDTFWLGELLRMMNLNQYSHAAAQPGLAVERIKFLRIPIPPYEEQLLRSSG